MKRIYSCDICGDVVKDPCTLFGVNFSNLTNFTLGGYGSTENKHICYRCASQLRLALISEPITEELAQYEIKESQVTDA